MFPKKWIAVVCWYATKDYYNIPCFLKESNPSVLNPSLHTHSQSLLALQYTVFKSVLTATAETKWAAESDRSCWMYGMADYSSLIDCEWGWDANWLGFQPGVHKQEAMKGFDMQQWTVAGRQGRTMSDCQLLSLQPDGLNPRREREQARDVLNMIIPCIWSCLQGLYRPWKHNLQKVEAQIRLCCSVETFS